MGIKNFYLASNKYNYKPFGVLPDSYDLSFIEDSSPPTGASYEHGAPAETPDGVITDFTLPKNFVDGSEMVHVNGVLYTLSAGMYSVPVAGGAVVRFAGGFIPQTGDVIQVGFQEQT